MEDQIIAKCNRCGGDIVDSPRAFGCSNWKDADGGCKNTVWKTIAGRPISEDEAKALFEHGKTELLTGFISKNGSPFAAYLTLSGEGTKFEFPPR